ncbi:MAG: M28 family peptidase [Bacteroidetes bacterium]|nr:M28 family peptidase [Bacteroidota bacterium]
MKDQIQEIISRFGPRPAGSRAEHQAQDYIANDMLRHTDDVQVLSFQAPLTAKFGKMKLYAALYLLALIVFWFSPLAATCIAVLNAIVLVSDLMQNRGLADFLYPQKTSWNVSATLEPQKEVKSTLIFSGHIDSTHECTWWYRFKQYGAHLTIATGLMIVFFAIYLLTYLLADYFIYDDMPDFTFYVYLFFVIISPLTIIYFTFHGPECVPGACDNLSGIIIAKNVVSAFADPAHRGQSILQHTRLRFLSFGSEEKGLRGSTAYVEDFIDKLRSENAHLVNIDSVRLPDHITLVTGEVMSFVSFDKFLVDQTQKAFKDINIPYKTARLPMGGTDAIPFQQKNIPSMSIIGMDTKKLDPTYHTRLDVTENVDQRALDNTRDALAELVRQWDRM